MPRTKPKAYRDTSVSWTTSQGQIIQMLNKNEIFDVQFTTISQSTAEQSGLKMDRGSVAIMLVFQKEIKLPDGRGGKVPVRIIIPNVSPDSRDLNQNYRLIYWYLKSKFEAIDTGLVEFAEEFMAHLQITDKSGVGRLWERFRSNFYRAISSGNMPDANLLPPMSEERDDDQN